ncbi:nucleotidyltransferase family protein [Sphingobium bisphenolivorans]|uniref:nucleotidyltransferase family protein n=1 Tax=Sphingobium bisphenolivorans TaxID=1335760 RepID=UPI00039E2A91|nr:nucleotidyltransferase family protein [Sphingobium bisphenolivorans]
MNRLDHLRGLLACLRGEVPVEDQWMGIIEMANHSLCTPLVASRLRDSGRLPLLPSDVQRFLEEIYGRNEERNQRLYGQLDEAAKLLNDAGIEPVVLKGTAWLAAAAPAKRGDRLLSDLDLLVPPQQIAAAVSRLQGLGYQLEAPHEGPDVPLVLFRLTDAATIDLHSDYGSRTTLHYGHGDIVRDGARHRLAQGTVYLPSTVTSVAILLLHDQLKGRDYLRGRIDLRHLVDIQSLAHGMDAVAWRQLDGLFAAGYARSAARTQLRTAKKLLGLNVPAASTGSIRAVLQYRRRLMQVRWPATALPLTMLSLLDPQYLRARRTWRAAAASPGAKEAGGRQASKWLPRRTSVERLLSWREIGKI